MDTFSALADPTRRHIIELLANNGQLTATELSAQFQISAPAISQHLKVLREAKLVDMEKRAQQRVYHMNPAAMSEIEGWVQKMTERWNARFEVLDQILEVEKRKAMNRNKTKITAEPGKQEIVITREFEAPRELVFKAFTDPGLYAQWLGPRGHTTTFETFEAKNGGKWRYISKDQDGNEAAFHGVYHEVLAPERIIGTFEYEGLPEKGHVILETAKFIALPGERTRVISQGVYQSVTDRDGMLQAGMETGVNEGYERLDELLGSMSENVTGRVSRVAARGEG